MALINTPANNDSENTVTKELGKDTIVIQQLSLTTVDRTPKDIGTWRDAIRNAESLYAPNRTKLLDLYEDVRLDGHLTGLVEKRIAFILNKALHFESRDGERVDAMEELLESEVFYDIITQLMESRFFGLSGLEFIPGAALHFKPIPRKHIKIERGIIALTQNDITGIPYADNKQLWIVGKPFHMGLYLQCAPYAIFKKGNMSDWAQFIEIFGQPFRVGRYDTHDTETRIALKQALDNMGSSFAAMIPKQAEFEIMDGKQSNANGDLQAKFREACNEELSVIILGNTETTGKAQGSGYAIAKEHGRQQSYIHQRDMSWLLQQLNSQHFKDILASYGYPVQQGHFAWEKERDLNELVLRLQVDQGVAKEVPFDDDYWYRTYGIDKPANYEQLKADREAQRQALQPANPAEAQQQQQQQADARKAAANDLIESPGFIKKLRIALADFFDPAP